MKKVVRRPFIIILGGFLAVLLAGGVFMTWMPGRSHQGPLPSPTSEETKLEGNLKVHVTMLALESIGYFREPPGSQRYPFPLSLLFPDTGDFIGFVGSFGGRSLLCRTVDTFRRVSPFPSEGVSAPEFFVGIGWSDHWSFWQEGYPAVMVTDTAPFRNPHYHKSTDTPDKLDYGRFARATAGLARVVRELVR
jgi:hypothetical protein